MDFSDRLHVAVDVLFNKAKDDPPPGNVRTLSPLTKDDVESFHKAAEYRDNPLFEEMERLLLTMKSRYPVRSTRMIRELRWLRGLAHENNMAWGKPYKWWQR